MILAAKRRGQDTLQQTETSTAARELLASRKMPDPNVAVTDAAPSYSRELYRTSLLAPHEERLLFKWLSELKQLIAELTDVPDDIRCEEACLDMQSIEQEMVAVRNHIVESNLRLVVSIAKKFRNPSDVEFHDLICEGNAILIKAVNLFKVEYGYRFSTYATTALQRGFFTFVQREQKRRSRFKSGHEEPFEDIDDGANPMEQPLEALHDVTRLLEELDEREHKIIVSRYGLVAGEKRKTFRELGDHFGLSKERIRQIANKALAKMKRRL